MKRSVKITVIILAALAVLAASYLAFNFGLHRLADSGEFSRAKKLVLFPNTEPEMSAYIDAGIEYENGSYEAAYEKFLALGNYRLSEDYANDALYLHADRLAGEHEFDAACELYAKLSDLGYKDSDEKVTDTRIAKGLYLCETKSYSDALDLFNALSDDGCVGVDDMVKDALCKWARSLINSGDYITAYGKIEEAAGYPGADAMREEIFSHIYDEGVLEYQRGRYEESQKYFAVLPSGYGSSDDYRILIGVHMSDDGYASYYDQIVEMLGFEDTADMLVSDAYIGIKFLQGSWLDDDGHIRLDCSMNGFRCYLNNRQAGRVYITIQAGVVYAYNMYATGEMVDVVKDLRITILDYDTISVHCYANGEDVVIHRKAA